MRGSPSLAPEPRELLLQGQRVRVFTQGEGPPLLLLHGVPAGAALWGPLLPLLSQFRVVAPDLPGFGLSQRPARLDAAFYREFLRQLRQELDLGSDTRLVGQDWGGLLACESFLRQGGRSLLLISCPLDYAWLGSRITAIPPLSYPFYRLFAGRLYLASAVSGAARAAFLQACQPSLSRPDLVDTMRQIAGTLDLRQMRQMRQGLRGGPLRLLWGERDRMFPARVAQRTARTLQAPLTLVPDTGQGLPFERPEAVLQELLRQ